MTTPIELMPRAEAADLLDRALDGSIARGGRGFREPATSSLGSRGHLPTLLERLSDRVYGEEGASYDPRPLSDRGSRRRAARARAVRRMRAAQALLVEYRTASGRPLARMSDMAEWKQWRSRLCQARGLA